MLPCLGVILYVPLLPSSCSFLLVSAPGPLYTGELDTCHQLMMERYFAPNLLPLVFTLSLTSYYRLPSAWQPRHTSDIECYLFEQC